MDNLITFVKNASFDDFINLINTSKTTLLTSNKMFKYCELMLIFCLTC